MKIEIANTKPRPDGYSFIPSALKAMVGKEINLTKGFSQNISDVIGPAKIVEFKRGVLYADIPLEFSIACEIKKEENMKIKSINITQIGVIRK